VRIHCIDGFAAPSSPVGTLDVLALNQAIERLAVFDARCATIVEMRFFAGLSIAEVAASLVVSDWTIENEWRVARAWLARELNNGCDQ